MNRADGRWRSCAVKYINFAALTVAVDYITVKGKQYITGLTELFWEEMELTDADIEALRHMTNLQHLELAGNNISDISALAVLAGLMYLDLGRLPFAPSNSIGDISSLANLTELTKLWLEGNNISDWSPVAHVQEVSGHP
jgi:Leucine-rich repeat (LRR) protein